MFAKLISLSSFLRPAALALLVLINRHPALALPISPPAGAIPPLDELAGDWQNAAEVRCLPAINNLRGSAQSSATRWPSAN